MTRQLIRLRCVRVAAFCALASVALAARARAEVPVFVISHADSTISFHVRASVDLRGTFDKWNATLTFASQDVTSGVLRVTVQAASVDTGSSLKNRTLKSPNFFNVEQQPLMTFVSRTISETGPDSFQVAATSLYVV